MSSKVESLQRASLHNPVRVSISATSHETVKTLVQNWILCPHKDKDLYLVYLLSDTFHGQMTIVFTRTQAETQRLTFLLRSLGLDAIPIHGGMSQSTRMGALGKFRARSRNILVATDVAARGLDIPSVDCVLNFDLPDDSKVRRFYLPPIIIPWPNKIRRHTSTESAELRVLENRVGPLAL